ncbi:hypothetical protein QFZ84_004924, partial [Pseudomonas fluorescens]
MFKRMFQTDSVRCGVERPKDCKQIRQEKARLGGRAFRWVRQAWRVARKRNQFGCGGHAGDLEVKVLYT